MATKIFFLCILLSLFSVIYPCQLAVSSFVFIDHSKNFVSVCNIDTGLNYTAIQEAIDAPETSNGDTITVGSGTYFEHITLNKSLTILGENPKTTIVDGEGVGTTLHITADGVCLSGFTINNSGKSSPPLDCGILLDYCSGCNISYNVVIYCRYGIYFFHSYGNMLTNNNVSDCHEDGIWLYHSGNNLLINNKMINNRYNFGVFGNNFEDFNNTLNNGNFVDGKSIQYLVDARDLILNDSEGVGCLYIINSYNVTIANFNLTGNGHGLFCWNTTHSKIENVTSFENNYGIYLQSSDENEVSHSFCANDWVGISLEDSTLNKINNNTVSYSEKGISLYNANDNNITANNILYNLYGIRLFASSFNNIYLNNLTANAHQVDLITSYQNHWNSSVKGNFWSDFSETYPNASEIDSSGVWDTPYIIDGTNQDNYPIISESQSLSTMEFCILFFTMIWLISKKR